MERETNFKLLKTSEKYEDVWCPTTTTGTWIAVHPDTGREFITGNCTHSTPNIAQIPAVKEFRELFTAPTGYVLVGADLANI